MSRRVQSVASETPALEEMLPRGQEVAPTRVEYLDDRVREDHIVAMLRLVWAQRVLLFKSIAVGLVASTLVAFLISKRYTSTVRLMPPDDQSGSGLAMAAAALSGRSGGLGGALGDVLGLKSTSDMFVGILGSRTAEDQLVQQFNLKKVYGTRTTEDARKELADHTNILIDRKSQIITIQITDGSPQRAAAMGQSYVEELNHLVSELSTSSARRERIFLEGRLQSVNQDLARAEKEFSQFASKNTAIDVPAQGKAMVEAAAMLQGQLIAAQSELEGLKQIYSDQNVRVRSGAARVAELQDQLDKLGGRDDGTLSAPGRKSDSMYPSIRKLPLLGVEYADLFRQTKVQEALFETLTQQYELAKVQEAKEIPTVKVLDYPDIPEKKSYPPRLMIIVLGTALVFTVGLVWIFASAMWDSKDSTDAGKILVQEVFSVVTPRLPWLSPNGSSVDRQKGLVRRIQGQSSDEVVDGK